MIHARTSEGARATYETIQVLSNHALFVLKRISVDKNFDFGNYCPHMADKKINAEVKLVIGAGQAKPVPPVGSTLGPYGLNLMQFCKEFNDATAGMTGSVPCVVTIYEDRSFSFVLKTPAGSELVKQALNLQKGASDPLRSKVGTLSRAQVNEIAEKKMPDLNCYTVEQAAKMVEGTCRSMGVKVEA